MDDDSMLVDDSSIEEFEYIKRFTDYLKKEHRIDLSEYVAWYREHKENKLKSKPAEGDDSD